MQSGDRRGQSSKQPGHEPQPGENVPLDVPTLLRMAADAYEERVMPMFEGYVLSLKGHFNREVGVLRTDLQSATTSIRQLETSVTTEFENMKKLIKGPGYNDEEPQIGGGSPYRLYFPYCGPDHDVRGAFVPPAKGNASAPVYAASTASPGVSKSGEDNVLLTSDIGSMRIQGHRVLSPDPPQPSVLQMEFSESAAVDVDSHGGPLGDKDTESMGPVPSNVEPPLAQSTGCRDHVVVEPMETHPHDSHEAPPQDPLPTVSESHTVPDVSGVVNQILSDAGISKELPHPSNLPGNVVGGQCQSSKFGTRNEQQELPHPSPAPANVAAGPSVSSKFVPENEKETISVGSETHGSDPVEEPSELGVEKNDEGVGDVPAADDAAGAGARRVSKRKHNSPQRFSPSEPTVRKEATKKSTKNVPGNKQASKRAKKNAPASSNPTPPTRVLPVFIGGFNAFAPPTPENRDAFLKRLNAAKYALDRVVTFICNRRDRLPSARFEFVPPSFFLELMRNYAGFDAIKEKHKFAFSTLLNHSLCTVLGGILTLISSKMSAMYVVDSNSACPSTVDVTSYLTPISTMLPHLISRYCLVPNPGFSGVAALILLDMVAADQPLNRLSLTEEEVRVAAENYAIASLSMG
ncbi:hypothetical protein Bca52824_047090 [Brassica carinata]|uniref:Uncharacterized protein n=1 Tax=Brassica carinata TaxID=52824 RepID=A0A8X7RFP6_BRACI|nr:hypothetical protein Bca52824_047090 [Brassica carinata]